MDMNSLPTSVPPGRAWNALTTIETQIAVIAADPSGLAQADAISALGAKAAERDKDVPTPLRPLAIGALPAKLTFAEAFDQVTDRRPLRGLLGLGGDDAGPVMVDFSGKTSAFLVCGPPGTGRSTVLVTFAVSLLASGTKIVAITPRISPLRGLAAFPNCKVLADKATSAQTLEANLAELGAPCVVIVDDGDLMALGAPADPVLRRIVSTGRDQGLALAFSTTPETSLHTTTGWIGEARRLRQGLLLNPQTAAEGDIVGTRIPANQLRRPARLGRGFTADPVAGGLRQIALPLTEISTGQ
jgi:S-DNA-T family DNA segregation ATPase FtsK/SpoIIIE